MTKKQRTARLASIDAQIDVVTRVVRTFEETFNQPAAHVIDGVYDAWNAAQSALDSLIAERRIVENYRPIPAGQEAIYQMISENRD